MSELYGVVAHNFCCGLIVEDGVVVEAAPIMRWAEGKTIGHVSGYCRRKGWKIKRVE